MAATKLDVRTTDGLMDVYLYGSADAPTVIFYPDAGGVRETMHEMADRLAGGGYRVALVNLLYRAGDFEPLNVPTLFSDPAELDRMRQLTATATIDGVMSDTGSLLEALGPAGAAVGTVGYCLGGAMAFAAAGAHPEHVVAAASIHGGRLASELETSPHRRAGAARGELYFGVAARDSAFPAEQEARLVATLDAAAVRYELEHYAAEHGFAVPDNPTYDAAAAERHWLALGTLFGRTLAPA
jgi:carboxymethylenebutenolidase